MIIALLSLISINGRQTADLYQVAAPSEWKVTPGEIGSDTKKPLVEFLIDGQIRITLHSFPGQSIPPQAQMARWKGQFEKLNPEDIVIQPVAWSGYSGYHFEAQGILQGKETTMIAWTLQLDSRHVRTVQDADKAADFTIKVVGPTDLVNKWRLAIELFAKSFELKDEIPFEP